MDILQDAYDEGYEDAKAEFATAIRKMTPRFVLCPKGWQGVRQTRYYCPACKKPTRDHEKFCHNCGQAVKYPKVVVSKAENKLILDWKE